MRSRFEALSDSVRVFRMARVGGGFLPAGHVLPKPEWLEPDPQDIAEGERTGRPAGVSVWDAAIAKHEDACWIRQVQAAEQLSFSAEVGRLKHVASQHQRELAIVADPLPSLSTDPRWETLQEPQRASITSTASGHTLVEGIRRPAGVSKGAHKSFREELAQEFERLAG